jgi:hypothetical protein
MLSIKLYEMKYSSTTIFKSSGLILQEKGDTLLIKAARLGKDHVVCLLLHAGAAIEATNEVT